ncbi:MAG: Gx transporter family protein [Ruminococcus sp.]|nr:Gx transporter family protein [Ruminococcus sp.]
MKGRKRGARELAEMGLLTAAALIIFVIELRIPPIIPIPGIKPGLANIVTVYAVYTLSAGDAVMILTERVLIGSIFGGNMSALIFSMSGGALCITGMLFLRKVIDERHMWLCSVFGAILHNIGQLGAAVVVMKTTAVMAYTPFLMVSACVTGLFTGLCAQAVVARSKKSEARMCSPHGVIPPLGKQWGRKSTATAGRKKTQAK